MNAVSVRASTARTNDFVEQIAVLLEADGLPRVAGRLFGLLLVSAEPLSLDELAARLRVSKASVSINIRRLEEKGVVERIGRQADRRDYYRIADDILERTLEQRIERWRRFHEAIAGARETCVITHDVVRTRLASMENVYRHMLDATARALEEWRVRHGKRPTPPTARAR